MAYLSVRLMTRKRPKVISLQNEFKQYRFGGNVRARQIEVIDFGRRCMVVGSGKRRSYSLLDKGTGGQFSLSPYEGAFLGFDFSSGTSFRGVMGERSVSIYDSEHNLNFVYRY